MEIIFEFFPQLVFLALTAVPSSLGCTGAQTHCYKRVFDQAPVLLQVGQQQSSRSYDMGTPEEVFQNALPTVKGMSFAALGETAAALHSASKDLSPEAGFFDAFSNGESTWDPDGSNLEARAAEESIAVGPDSGQSMPTLAPPESFHETESAGPKEAWQTYGLDPDEVHPYSDAPAWHELVGGKVEQGWYNQDTLADFVPVNGNVKDPAWFETRVDTTDGFGRPRQPSPQSALRYIEWNETRRSVNLTCDKPGCTANATLQVLGNISEMEYRLCKLSVLLHATDFDDEYSREMLEWLVVNDKEVLRNFTPLAKGQCGNVTNPQSLQFPQSLLSISSKSSQAPVSNNGASPGANMSVGKPPVESNILGAENEPLYPCLQEFPLEQLLKQDGKINISGKISSMVDECPVNGNFLSAVVVASCFERPIPPPLPPLPVLEKRAQQTTANLSKADFKTNVTVPLRCKAPGCIARANLVIQDYHKATRKCKLSVRIKQTDFDGSDGTHEVVEWVQVNGKNLTTNVKPGKNPCEEAKHGKPSKLKPFPLLQEKDVTAAAVNDSIALAVKISDMVDECGIDGYLLVGEATLHCD
eukprot:TRINITY_DN42549_c0_g1_i1.p1 TRINITY_DN42549_c0_g1~~TRINITY_DN42549_c0_g1_i1.p1  ORF type:complete len:586 (+),score=102.32 TRINITY_DN42549_c0_g1_i1:155-1912(+)